MIRKKIDLKLLLFIFYTTQNFEFGLGYIETCNMAENELPKIQILFIVDGGLSPENSANQIQIVQTKEMMRLTKLKQPVAEFALAAYYNWQDQSTGKVGNCYKLLQSFTRNQDEINAKVAKLTNDPNDNINNRKCSFTMALFMGMVDKEVKWDDNLAEVSKPTKKFIVGCPFRESLTKLQNSDGRRDPIGDGSDTCQNSNPPSGRFLQDMFYRNHIYLLLNAYLDYNFPEEERDYTAEYSYHYDPHNSGVVLKDIEPSPFYFLLEYYYTEEQPFRSDTAVKASDTVELTQDLFDILMKECVICLWENPQGYNSLGL